MIHLSATYRATLPRRPAAAAAQVLQELRATKVHVGQLRQRIALAQAAGKLKGKVLRGKEAVEVEGLFFYLYVFLCTIGLKKGV